MSWRTPSTPSSPSSARCSTRRPAGAEVAAQRPRRAGSGAGCCATRTPTRTSSTRCTTTGWSTPCRRSRWSRPRRCSTCSWSPRSRSAGCCSLVIAVLLGHAAWKSLVRVHGRLRGHQHAGVPGDRGALQQARHHAAVPDPRHHRRPAVPRPAARLRPLHLRVRGAGAGAARHPVRRQAARARPGDPAARADVRASAARGPTTGGRVRPVTSRHAAVSVADRIVRTARSCRRGARAGRTAPGPLVRCVDAARPAPRPGARGHRVQRFGQDHPALRPRRPAASRPRRRGRTTARRSAPGTASRAAAPRSCCRPTAWCPA